MKSTIIMLLVLLVAATTMAGGKVPSHMRVYDMTCEQALEPTHTVMDSRKKFFLTDEEETSNGYTFQLAGKNNKVMDVKLKNRGEQCVVEVVVYRPDAGWAWAPFHYATPFLRDMDREVASHKEDTNG
jgi:hypothetical protein